MENSHVRSILMVLLFLAALFLIMFVLVQRGRGGGLAGEFGGMGGTECFRHQGRRPVHADHNRRSVDLGRAVRAGVKYYNTPDSFSTTLGGAAKARVDVRPGNASDFPGAVPGSATAGEGAKAVEGARHPPARRQPTEAAPATPAETPAAPADAPAAPAEAPASEAPKQ